MLNPDKVNSGHEWLAQVEQWLRVQPFSNGADTPNHSAERWNAVHDRIKHLIVLENQHRSLKVRIEKLLEVIIKHSQLNFDEEAPITANFDELDGISLGINTLAEEFAFHQQKIEQLNKDLRLLLYRSSHDLRGPVSSIHGLVELLSVTQQIDDQTRDDFMELIETSYRTLNKLSNCSMVVQSEIQKVPLHFPLFMQEWMQSSANLYTKFDVKLQLDNRTETVHTDPNGLRLILNNLLENCELHAFENYTPGNTLEIEVKDYANELQIHFKDNGIGLSDLIASQVFTMFFKGGHQSKTSGLGLYTSKRMAQALGGDLTLVSARFPTDMCLRIPNSNSDGLAH